MFRIFETLQLGTCLLCINLIFVVVSAFLGWIPSIINFILRLVQGFLVISQRLYRFLFSQVAQLTQVLIGFHLNTVFWRTLFSTLLSISLVFFVGIAVGLKNITLPIILAALHGIAIGVLWDDLSDPAGLRLGVRLE